MKNIFVLVIFILSACSKSNREFIPVEYTGTQILIHKGGGGVPYGKYQENTMASCREGFEFADGIEIDLQKSRNETIWLQHDEYFKECDINKKGRIPAYIDEEIQKHIECIGGDYTLTKLEEVFRYHHENKLSKTIHLDVKPWLPTIYSDGFGYLNDEADEIIRLAKKYDVEKYLIAECEAAFFLNRIKKQSDKIQLFLDSFGDFDVAMRKAIKAGYHGICYKVPAGDLTKEQIQNAHDKGLKVNVWTINDSLEIEKYISYQVDYILTDNIQFVQ